MGVGYRGWPTSLPGVHGIPGIRFNNTNKKYKMELSEFLKKETTKILNSVLDDGDIDERVDALVTSTLDIYKRGYVDALSGLKNELHNMEILKDLKNKKQ